MKVLAIVLCLALLLCSAAYLSARAVFPLSYQTEIQAWSKAYDVDPYLIMGIIRAESSFHTDAVSSAEAIGLMQLTETTAGQIAQWLEIDPFTKEQLFDGNCNIRFGTYYIRWLIEQFQGNLKNALAAYNAGIGTVKNWLADSNYSEDGSTLHTVPYTETAAFINRVLTYREIYRLLYPT